jgi:3'(2'), 5'-bisphosphate nucleotidase
MLIQITMSSIINYIPELTALIKQAGASIMEHFNHGYEVSYKDDNSPVTNADDASEKIIISKLLEMFPEIPIVSEETSVPDVTNAYEFWLIDPLDGTKEFIKGTHDFTINIGLIRDGKPVFGLVYLPASDELYYGGERVGAFFNGSPISTRPYNMNDGLSIVGRKDHPHKDKLEKRRAFLKGHKIKNYVVRGSSLKFCMVADGQAHLYPRFVPTYEWDTAAAHAILLETGGDIIDFKTKERLQYGKFDKDYLNGYLVTGTNDVLKQLL